MSDHVRDLIASYDRGTLTVRNLLLATCRHVATVPDDFDAAFYQLHRHPDARVKELAMRVAVFANSMFEEEANQNPASA